MKKKSGNSAQNKKISGLEFNVEHVIITLNHWFWVFNVCCDLQSVSNGPSQANLCLRAFRHDKL